MSSYEDYNRVSRTYDGTRRPVGLQIVLDGLSRCETPFERMKLVDAGCGTGAYMAALQDHIPNIVALDYSVGMLEAARRKNRSGETSFLRASIQMIPVSDGAADAVLNNLVLHHLPDNEADGYPAQQHVLEEFARILRPGGALVIGVCTRDQLRQGFWFNRLIPEAIAACSQRTAPVEKQRTMLEEAGFAVEEPIVPWAETLQGDAYFDRLGPLDPVWRDGDSVWSLAPPEELESACRQVRDMENAGTLSDFVASHDKQRLATGQITYLCATRR